MFAITSLTTILLALAPADGEATYEDTLLPILRNECLACHNPDKKKAGLDLSTYQGVLAGSSSGAVVVPGEPDQSLIYRVVMHRDEPFMPRGKKDRLPERDLEAFRRWIAGGVLERTGSKPVASKRPKIDLNPVTLASGKPAELPPMPNDLLLEPVQHTARPGPLRALAIDPWLPLAALAGEHQVLLYDTQGLALVGVLPFPEGEPFALEFSQSGRLLLVGGGQAAKSGRVVLVDVTTGERVAQLGDEFDVVLAASLSPDQSRIALGGPGKTVKVLATTDGALLQTMKKHTDWVSALAFSPDGVLLASADRAGGLVVWEAKSGQEYAALAGHKAAVTAIAFRDDANVLASASEDGSVKLWDMASGAEVKSWPAHPGGTLSVAFAHDGRLVTSGRDRVVRVWQGDGVKLRDLEPLLDVALHAAFAHAGARVIAGDWSGAVRAYRAADGVRLGDLDLDPPTLAARIEAATKGLAELDAARAQPNADAAAIDHDIAAARAAIARWQAAQFNVTVHAARSELAALESECEQQARAVDAAQVKLAQAEQDRASTAQLIATAPQRIEDRQKRIGEAQAAVAAVRAEQKQAEGVVAAREAMQAQANDLATKLLQAAQAAPADQSLAAAAAQAQAAVAPIAATVDAARRDLAAIIDQGQRAAAALAAAEAAVAAERSEAEKLEAVLAQREQAAVDATEALRAARLELDQHTRRAVAARAHVQELQAEYQRRSTATVPAPTIVGAQWTDS
ncbi:MAG: c-type cytochrome domain-containing protein [Planctomycetota bacterium]